MTNIIHDLVDVAAELEGKKLTDLASRIDKLAEKVLTIKTAQYVGAQGYFIRQERCFGNCYRQKRATKPSLAAQEVWEECHKEYLASINDDKSGWEKYAEKQVDFRKIAGIDPLIAKRIVQREEKFFQTKVAQQLQNGEQVPVAVYNTIDDGLQQYVLDTVNSAKELVDIAQEIKAIGQPDVADKVAAAAETLLKEAKNPFSRALGWMQRQWSGQSPEHKQISQALNSLLTSARQNYQELAQGRQQAKDAEQKKQIERQWGRDRWPHLQRAIQITMQNISKQAQNPKVDQAARQMGVNSVKMLNTWLSNFRKNPTITGLGELEGYIQEVLMGSNANLPSDVTQQVAKQRGQAQQPQQPSSPNNNDGGMGNASQTQPQGQEQVAQQLSQQPSQAGQQMPQENGPMTIDQIEKMLNEKPNSYYGGNKRNPQTDAIVQRLRALLKQYDANQKASANKGNNAAQPPASGIWGSEIPQDAAVNGFAPSAVGQPQSSQVQPPPVPQQATAPQSTAIPQPQGQRRRKTKPQLTPQVAPEASVFASAKTIFKLSK